MSKSQLENDFRTLLAAFEAEIKAEIKAESKAEKWEPEGVFVMLNTGGIEKHRESHSHFAKMGNARATEALARRAVKRRLPRDLIAAYVDQYAPDYEPDLSDKNEQKFFIVYKANNSEWVLDFSCYHCNPCQVYMPEWLGKQLIEDIKSGRVDLGYPVGEKKS